MTTPPTPLQTARLKLGRALLAYLLQHELPDDLRGNEINRIVLHGLSNIDVMIADWLGRYEHATKDEQEVQP